MRGGGTLRGVVVRYVERVDFLGAAQRDQIGQAGTRLVVEAAPVFLGADDLGGLDAVSRSQARFQMMTRHPASMTKVGTTSCSMSRTEKSSSSTP